MEVAGEQQAESWINGHPEVGQQAGTLVREIANSDAAPKEQIRQAAEDIAAVDDGDLNISGFDAPTGGPLGGGEE